MTQQKAPEANPLVVLREEFDDWAVVFNPDTAEAAGLNPVGVSVFKLLDGTRTIGQIVDAVKAEYDDVPDTVETEVRAFIDDLLAKGYAGYETKSAGK